MHVPDRPGLYILSRFYKDTEAATPTAKRQKVGAVLWEASHPPFKQKRYQYPDFPKAGWGYIDQALYVRRYFLSRGAGVRP